MRKITIFGATLLTVFGTAAAQTPGDSEIRYNQYGVEVTREPLEVESRDGILVFESRNQNYRLWFDLRLQLDGAVFFGKESYIDPIGNGATIRRARFAVKGQIHRNWYGEIDTDFANGEFELKDALLRFNGLANWSFTAGNFKEDFSMEQTTSSRYLPFMERPMVVSAFAPSRHLGLQVQYGKGWFYASAGAHLQVIDNLETYEYVKDNNKDYGRNQGISYTGKVIFMPFYKHLDYGMHIGLGGSYRTPKTDVSTSDYGTVRYDVRNNTSINRKKYLDTDVIPNVNYEFLYNFELAGFYRGFRFQGEYIGNNVYIDRDAPVNVDTRAKFFRGFYAQAGVLLFGGRQRYNRAEGEFTQPSRGRKWGDIELLARYDYLDLNSNDIFGGSGENYTVGVNYYVNHNIKFVLNYQYTRNDRYANGKGKLTTGRDAQGNPTSNFKEIADANGKAGVRYSMLGMRMEINF